MITSNKENATLFITCQYLSMSNFQSNISNPLSVNFEKNFKLSRALKKTAANSLARSFLKLNLLIPLFNF